ncbi:MAG TPA: hypothetical protein VJG83_03200 [archaeon]|nr:hypothetical protein [archaeon]
MAKKTEKETHKTKDPYDDEQVEEMLENDEVDPQEAGFMEGYNQKQSEKPKKPNEIAQGKNKR